MAQTPADVLVPSQLIVPEQYRTGVFATPRTLYLPPGFRISVFASGLGTPRHFDFGANGDLYVAQILQGQASTLPDRDRDGVADRVTTLIANLLFPHGVTVRGDNIYIAETDRVRVYRDLDGNGVSDTGGNDALLGLPPGGLHLTRSIRFGPDGRLYVSVGSSCNVCFEDEDYRATITSFDLATRDERTYAEGLRNAVGFDFSPVNGRIWAVDNGRDGLGDDSPPETLYVLREGDDAGWPNCHAGRILDPQFGFPGACHGALKPAIEMQAHMAPLGLAFGTGLNFPAGFPQSAFIAFHGSSSRSIPTGYKVARAPTINGAPTGEVRDFVTGWLVNGVPWGRPVGVEPGPDGALYISDDLAGAIYRVSYGPSPAAR